MEINGYSAKVGILLMYITWIHILAKCEEHLLNTSEVISKISFEQRGMLHQDYQPF